MIRIALQTCLTVMALLISASASFALPNCASGQYHNCWGSLTFETGAKYVGEFRNELFHGKGTLKFPSGGKYVGWFKNGQKNGQGTQTWSDGSKYTGEYENDSMNGHGTFIYSSGDKGKYVGDWKDGQRNGQGAFTWAANGNEYVGGWKNDARNGQGTTTFPDGTVYKGFFKNNNFIEGIFKDKFSVEGVFKDKTFHYPSKTPYEAETSLLGAAYIKLSASQRKRVQSILSGLEFYKSSVDGLYGKGTAAALITYNKQKLNAADLRKSDNVNKLLTAVLALKPSPTLKPKVIQTDKPDKTYKVASGTGFYVSDEGHVITNHHVIDGCMDMKVHSKGRVLATLQIAADKQNDLALLKIAEVPNHVFALSNNSPFPLQEIIVAGFPFGDKYSSSLKFTQGIVSSLTGMGDNYSEIQIDAALQQGNSGGPIIDEYGNIIAVAVAKLDAKYMFDKYGIIPENTNFGVKVSAVRNLMEGNGVSFKVANTEVPSRQELSRQATDGTVFLTCWMTMAQREKLRTKKVMFEDLN